MIKLTEQYGSTVFAGEKPIIYGYGDWGKRCLEHLRQEGIEIRGICDQRWKEYSEKEDQITFISSEELKEIQESLVIIAVEKFESILRFVAGFANKIYLYRKEGNSFYKVEKNYKILGCGTNTELMVLLKSKKRIALYGTPKHRKDFTYIFEDLNIVEELERDSYIGDYNEYDLIIQCEKEGVDTSSSNVVKAEDLFTLLAGDAMEHVKAYIMMMKTFSDKMVEQPPCIRPFQNAVINSAHDFHFCCGDWSWSIQNILQNSDLQNIWDSIEAKIYRLSIINRTYSFCDWKRCVYLRAEPKENAELERLQYKVKQTPDSLEIGIDKTCNLFCKSCRHQVIVEGGTRLDNINRSRQVIEQSGWIDQCNTLLLGGQGEVFVSPTYKTLMYQVKNNRNTLDLRTNGILLTETEFLKLRAIYSKLKIIISIDAATEGTYRSLRRSHDKNAWNKLVTNLEMLADKRKNKELDYFQINMCVQKENYAEIPEFVAWGDRLKVDVVYLTPIRNWGTYSEEEFKEISIFCGNEKVLKPEIKTVIESLRFNKINAKLEIAF